MILIVSVGAEEKKDEKIDGKLLVGKWKQYEPKEGSQATMEFAADGKLTAWIDDGDGKKAEPIRGTYKVTGNKILEVTDGDLTLKDEVVISKLTKDEFHTVKDGTLKMRRVELKK